MHSLQCCCCCCYQRRGDPGGPSEWSLCRKVWVPLRDVSFSPAFRSKVCRFNPNASLIPLQRACCCCCPPDGQSDGSSWHWSQSWPPMLQGCELTALLLQTQPPRKKKSVITEHMQLLNILFSITSACSENYISQFLYTVSVCQILPTRLP